MSDSTPRAESAVLQRVSELRKEFKTFCYRIGVDFSYAFEKDKELAFRAFALQKISEIELKLEALVHGERK